MPTRGHPLPAYDHGDNDIQPQGDDRRPTARRQADDPCPLVIPGKVFGPALLPRVEERHALAGLGVESFGLLPFGVIAESAGRPKVFFGVGPACCWGNDVLNFQPTHDQMLRTPAVAATISGL